MKLQPTDIRWLVKRLEHAPDGLGAITHAFPPDGKWWQDFDIHSRYGRNEPRDDEPLCGTMNLDGWSAEHHLHDDEDARCQFCLTQLVGFWFAGLI